MAKLEYTQTAQSENDLTDCPFKILKQADPDKICFESLRDLNIVRETSNPSSEVVKENVGSLAKYFSIAGGGLNFLCIPFRNPICRPYLGAC